jgi:ribosomal protein S18 acetylase RimI-like enzyme
MLWRVRTTLPDRPGALAALAARCGASGVNILGLQIFPGVDRVTDELVLRTPDDWELADLAELVEVAGGTRVSALPCTEAALADQPTRYVMAARAILAQPAGFPEVVARLFDAESDPVDTGTGTEQDVMDLAVGEVAVQVRRTASFTATEHTRGAALAALVTDVLAVSKQRPVPEPGRRVVVDGSPTYETTSSAVVALVGETAVGSVSWRDDHDECWHLELAVDPAWRRRGIGSRLLLEVARVARQAGAAELLVRTAADNQAVLPLVLGTGLRGRIRMGNDDLTVRIPVRQLAPTR